MKKKVILLGGILLLCACIALAYVLYKPAKKELPLVEQKILSGITIPLVNTQDHVMEAKAILNDMDRMIALKKASEVQNLMVLLRTVLANMSGYTLSDHTKEQIQFVEQQSAYLTQALELGDWGKVEIYFQKVRLLERL